MILWRSEMEKKLDWRERTTSDVTLIRLDARIRSVAFDFDEKENAKHCEKTIESSEKKKTIKRDQRHLNMSETFARTIRFSFRFCSFSHAQN